MYAELWIAILSVYASFEFVDKRAKQIAVVSAPLYFIGKYLLVYRLVV